MWFKVSARESDAPALRWLKHLPILDQYWRNLALIRAFKVSSRFCSPIEAMVHGLAAVNSTELNLNYCRTMKILIFSAEIYLILIIIHFHVSLFLCFLRTNLVEHAQNFLFSAIFGESFSPLGRLGPVQSLTASLIFQHMELSRLEISQTRDFSTKNLKISVGLNDEVML